ncbi:hypothetical protein L227DRAFT_656270 [Lentinus tigrinus ALCF2SS1-6]|uniref:F-box domain-containing protein n=1 Tax=Lentinus tigrinus ALCF2SS1-6 TaxID=1328759 RepID=A0A5C2RZE3_9APHY|nr:hypothetical protein L227DRAFT_656270 [Lentinus tigrinus ALCF2SS1-6]
MSVIVLPFPHDVLPEIAFWAPRDTCASLMLTCRFLYREAAKSALYQDAYLSGDAQIAKFLRFLYAEGHSRLRYVHSLQLRLYSISEETFQKLLSSVEQMIYLESLDIGEGEETLQLYPLLENVIVKRPSLRHLRISGVGWLSITLLDRLTCNLTSLDLDWSGSDESFLHEEVHLDLWRNYHPVPFLSKWRHSLRELRCSNWYTPHFEADDPGFTAVYPKMRSLTIVRDTFPDPLPYICAYPNLTHLSVETDHVEDLEHHLGEYLHERRKVNLARQLDEKGPGTWQHLEEFRGYLQDLYLLGLTCRIERIGIDNELNTRHGTLELLYDVLLYAQPRHLRVVGDGTLLVHPHPDGRSLPSILPPPRGSLLESLAMKVVLYGSDAEYDIVSGLDALACTLPLLPLRRLRLFVNSNFINPMRGRRPGVSQPDPPLPYNTAERSLAEFDVDAFMGRLTDAIPSLTDAIVVVQGPRGGERKWEIEPEGGRYLAPGLDRALFEVPMFGP